MSLKTNTALQFLAVAVLASFGLMGVAEAQPYGGGDRGGPGLMMGPGMMDGRAFGRMCGPRAAGFAQWQLDRLERAIKLTDAQRPKFDEFKTASTKAAETMRAACSADVPTTMIGRIDATEKRLDAMLQGVKAVKPALEAFYTTLSDEQKASLNDVGRRRNRFWRWLERW